VASLGEAGDHGVPRHDVPRGHRIEQSARRGDVPRAEAGSEERVGRDEEGVAAAQRGRAIEQARCVRGKEAGVEVGERGVRVRVGEEAEAEEVRVEGGRRGERGVGREAGHGLEDGGEGEGAGAVRRAERREVERDGAAGPALVRRGADGERPRRVEAACGGGGGGRGAHGQRDRCQLATSPFPEADGFVFTCFNCNELTNYL